MKPIKKMNQNISNYHLESLNKCFKVLFAISPSIIAITRKLSELMELEMRKKSRLLYLQSEEFITVYKLSLNLKNESSN